MPDDLNQYIFGNSLVNFAGGSALANVPHWLDQFYDAAGASYAVNGGYGFLRQFADRAVPGDEWGFAGVNGSWNSDNETFAQASFDHALITPANFIQNVSPTTNYAGDIRSPVDATLDVIAQLQTEQPGAKIYIYQGWADLGGFSNDFPASASDYAAYQAYSLGAYDDWYDTYLADLEAGAPTANIELIPVSRVLTELLSTGPLSHLTQTDLFVDSAPHGTDNVYFLAAVITYAAINGHVPASYGTLPASIHPDIVANLSQIGSFIDASVQGVVEITGTAGDDILRGDAGSNDVDAGLGNDRLIDADGGDTLRGGDGDDLYVINGDSNGAAVYVEEVSSGNDTIRSRFDVDLHENIENVILFDNTDVDVTGNTLANEINGNNGDNSITGGLGDDTIRASGGADTLLGGEGDDVLRGGKGQDLLFGDAGNDTLRGEIGADTLNGGADNDRLIGGAGNDALTGGAGADIFAFTEHFGFDRITDFEDTANETIADGLDRIDLSGLADLNGGASLSFDQLIISQVNTRARIQLDLNRDGIVDVIDMDGDGDLDDARIDLLDFTASHLNAFDFAF